MPWSFVEICKEKKYTRSGEDRSIIDIDARMGGLLFDDGERRVERKDLFFCLLIRTCIGEKEIKVMHYLSLNDYLFSLPARHSFHSKNHLNEKPHIFGYFVADNKKGVNFLSKKREEREELKRKRKRATTCDQ